MQLTGRHAVSILVDDHYRNKTISVRCGRRGFHILPIIQMSRVAAKRLNESNLGLIRTRMIDVEFLNEMKYRIMHRITSALNELEGTVANAIV